MRAFMIGVIAIVGCHEAGETASKAPAPNEKVKITSVELKDATYAELDKAVTAEKGNIVAVDVWATFCAPCVKRFPHFVEMHEKFYDKGLVCISASTDDKEAKDKALKFLKEKNALFANYRLSESNEKIAKELNERFPTDSQPIMIIFNRKGEKVKEFEGKSTAEEIDAFIEKLLSEK
jgi:thiol-disulfide isomerase/thioredoxin